MTEAILRYQQLILNEPPDFAARLRKDRHQVWLKAAINSFDPRTPISQICLEFSTQTDRLLQSAFRDCFDTSKYALFALGKLGAQELNLSSDVDLVIVTQDSSLDHLAALRKFQRLLADVTAWGFAYRVDFDLRPGGRHGPLVPTVDQFVDYYGNYGEAWERLALIRLRAIDGDPQIIDSLLKFRKQFCFRRHLDFNLLEELKGLRQKIHDEHWKKLSSASLHLKLSPGGIRDIELFVHALQVIHGGRNESLQSHSTDLILKKFGELKILPQDDANFLLTQYWLLRRLENQSQAQDDEQTHYWTKPLPEGLTQKMERTVTLVEEVIGKVNSSKPLDLNNLSEELQQEIQSILSIEILSRHKERDNQLKTEFLESFYNQAKLSGGHLLTAFSFLKDFVTATRAKANFFRLFKQEPKLVTELAWLFSHSPYLSTIVCQRPELLDSLLFRQQELHREDFSLLLEDLVEKKLLAEIIAGSDFLRTKNLIQLCQSLSQTADEIVLILLEELKKDYPCDLQVLSLGKWGGQEMGLRSDLDIIFVTPDAVDENHIKVARRLLSRISETHKGGSMYNVDGRLRPHGSAGPLVSSWLDLKNYIQKDAEPWQRQAYLRARGIGWDASEINQVASQGGLSRDQLIELDRIRNELALTATDLDLKLSPGGLIDIELAVQSHILLHQLHLPTNTLTQLGLLKLERLADIYAELRKFEQSLQLIERQSVTSLSEKSQALQHLAALFNLDSNDVISHLKNLLLQANQELLHLDPRRANH